MGSLTRFKAWLLSDGIKLKKTLFTPDWSSVTSGMSVEAVEWDELLQAIDKFSREFEETARKR